MTAVLMYDSTNAADIPAGAPAVAGYVDGQFAWRASDWERFPNAEKVAIAVTFTDAGDCLDVENGDATNAQAGAWVIARQKAGVARPWVYVNRSNLLALQEAIANSVGPGTEVGYWVADWTGEAHEIAGADAVQYADPNAGSGGHFDVSIVTGMFPSGATPPPSPAPPPPAPAPSGGIEVQVTQLESGSSGPEVKTVQSVLNGKAHAGLAVDGSFGAKTEEAVRAWQQFFRLEVDGVVGPATWPTLIGG